MSHQYWDYTEENGPDKWSFRYPTAAGVRQSPVDINTAICKRGEELPPLNWNYYATSANSLVNPGYCWRVDVTDNECILSGGPLKDNIYKLEQFHCHWGGDDTKGSEHTVNGLSYAGELHLVHWNITKYSTFQEATAASDGLAVLGVFLQAAAGQYHAEMQKLTSLLPFVKYKGDRITLPSGCNPGELLPNETGYWTYEGSLTTPPCSECVTWILFKTPINVSHEQLEAMRNLNCYDVREQCPRNELKGKIVNNFRPPLPLGNRELHEII